MISSGLLLFLIGISFTLAVPTTYHLQPNFVSAHNPFGYLSFPNNVVHNGRYFYTKPPYIFPARIQQRIPIPISRIDDCEKHIAIPEVPILVAPPTFTIAETENIIKWPLAIGPQPPQVLSEILSQNPVTNEGPIVLAETIEMPEAPCLPEAEPIAILQPSDSIVTIPEPADPIVIEEVVEEGHVEELIPVVAEIETNPLLEIPAAPELPPLELPEPPAPLVIEKPIEATEPIPTNPPATNIIDSTVIQLNPPSSLVGVEESAQSMLIHNPLSELTETATESHQEEISVTNCNTNCNQINPAIISNILKPLIEKQKPGIVIPQIPISNDKVEIINNIIIPSAESLPFPTICAENIVKERVLPNIIKSKPIETV